MTTTLDLKHRFLDLPDLEQKALIRELRALRRMPKPKKIKKKAAPKKKQKQLSLDDAVAKMNPEQVAQLIEKLKRKG